MNVVVLSGYLGGDAIADRHPARYGDAIIRFRLGVPSRQRDLRNRSMKKRVDWFACVMIASPDFTQYLLRGRTVLVRGNIHIKPYESDDRSYGSAITMFVEDLEFTQPAGPPPRPADPAREDIEDNKVPL